MLCGSTIQRKEMLWPERQLVGMLVVVLSAIVVPVYAQEAVRQTEAGIDRPITLRGHTDLVLFVAFSPDGRTLASASYDRTIKIWEIKTGQLQATYQRHIGLLSFESVAFSSDSKTLASGSSGTT